MLESRNVHTRLEYEESITKWYDCDLFGFFSYQLSLSFLHKKCSQPSVRHHSLLYRRFDFSAVSCMKIFMFSTTPTIRCILNIDLLSSTDGVHDITINHASLLRPFDRAVRTVRNIRTVKQTTNRLEHQRLAYFCYKQPLVYVP